jgi:MFS family permease
MVYTQLTMSPATIEFARTLGANGFHIGVLGALPAGMLFAQFFAAFVANHLRYRRWVWFWVSAVQRLLLVPAALAPLAFPDVPDSVWIWGLIAATAANHGLLHFCTPLWLSWMGDYLPRGGLSRFWGVRHLWMQWSAAAALFGAAVFMFKSGFELRLAFAATISVGAVFGVADLLLFLRIDEPRVTPLPEPKLYAVFAAPFHCRRFRSFITYSCFWNFAAMIGAPFISLYLLATVGMDLFHVMLLWAFSWAGGAVFSGQLGRLAESFGNRLVLIACTAFKATNMIALLLVPTEPTAAFWILVPVFMLDALLNAGIAIASNGFMLKHSPAANRSMFIAAGTAVAGIVGGATSLASGAVLAALAAWQTSWGNVVIGNFQVVFGASLLLRVVAVIFAVRVHEPLQPAVSPAEPVAVQLVGTTPLRILRFPVGLYRSPPEPKPIAISRPRVSEERLEPAVAQVD